MRETIFESIGRGAVYAFIALGVVGVYFLSTAISASLSKGSIESYAQQSNQQLLLPGTWLLRFEGSQEIYYIASEDELRQISLKNAQRLYGDDWTQAVLILPSDAQDLYVIGRAIREDEYPDYLFLTDGESRCYLEEGLCRPVTESGMRERGLTEQFLQETTSEIIHSFKLGELIDA